MGTPTLTFSVLATSKLHFMMDQADTEIGFMGVCSHPREPFFLTDLYLPKQECSKGSVEFDADDIADFQERMVEKGLQPYQFMRIWLHTHPGTSPTPSVLDEDTFRDMFGDASWSVMYIRAQEGDEYCRLQLLHPFTPLPPPSPDAQDADDTDAEAPPRPLVPLLIPVSHSTLGGVGRWLTHQRKEHAKSKSDEAPPFRLKPYVFDVSSWLDEFQSKVSHRRSHVVHHSPGDHYRTSSRSNNSYFLAQYLSGDAPSGYLTFMEDAARLYRVRIEKLWLDPDVLIATHPGFYPSTTSATWPAFSMRLWELWVLNLPQLYAQVFTLLRDAHGGKAEDIICSNPNRLTILRARTAWWNSHPDRHSEKVLGTFTLLDTGLPQGLSNKARKKLIRLSPPRAPQETAAVTAATTADISSAVDEEQAKADAIADALALGLWDGGD